MQRLGYFLDLHHIELPPHVGEVLRSRLARKQGHLGPNGVSRSAGAISVAQASLFRSQAVQAYLRSELRASVLQVTSYA